MPHLGFPRTSSAHERPLIFHSLVSFSAKRIGIPRETKRPDEISPRGKRRDRCKAFYCGGRPRFRTFAPPSTFTRNYRERTPGTRTRKETSRWRFSPIRVVERSKKGVRATPVCTAGVFRFWIVMARASKKRKLEDRVESSLEEVLYFRFRGEVVSTRVLFCTRKDV